LTEHQKPLARLVPERASEPERIPGLHAGMIWMSEDFDEPQPDEFWVESVTIRPA
jgi:antitoxin (DNA-binding transcriptional repressor) of toxin-antitoxin stability system